MRSRDRVLRGAGKLPARHLTKPLKGYSPPATRPPDALRVVKPRLEQGFDPKAVRWAEAEPAAPGALRK